MKIITLLIVITIIILLVHMSPIIIIFVYGDSMFPMLRHGDLLWVRKFVIGKDKVEVGKVYVWEHEGKYVIKRLKKIRIQNGESYCWVEGDNPMKSMTYDSRDYGWISLDSIRYKVLKDI